MAEGGVALFEALFGPMGKVAAASVSGGVTAVLTAVRELKMQRLETVVEELRRELAELARKGVDWREALREPGLVEDLLDVLEQSQAVRGQERLRLIAAAMAAGLTPSWNGARRRTAVHCWRLLAQMSDEEIGVLVAAWRQAQWRSRGFAPRESELDSYGVAQTAGLPPDVVYACFERLRGLGLLSTTPVKQDTLRVHSRSDGGEVHLTGGDFRLTIVAADMFGLLGDADWSPKPLARPGGRADAPNAAE